MSLINFTEATNGNTANASDINTPLNTIYDEFNGNISSVNLASNAVTTAKLADSSVTSEKLGKPVGFYATTTQSIGAGAITDLDTYTEVADEGSDFDHTTGIFTAPYAGLYHLSGHISVNNDAQRLYLEMKFSTLANVTTMSVGGFANGEPSAPLSLTVPLAAGETVQLSVNNQTSVTALNGNSFFSGHLVGRT